MDGSFADSLPIFFKEVLRSYAKDGKYMAQTQADPYFSFCRNQIPGLPNPVELKYENLKREYK